MYKENSPKKLVIIFICILLVIIFSYYFKNNYYKVQNFVENTYKKIIQKNLKQYLVSNEYQKKIDYDFVKINNNTEINNETDMKNAIYTYLDAGWEKYIITCSINYLTCVDDFKNLVSNKEYLTNISNFVHPFNTFEEFNTNISSSGKITLSKKNRYTNDQIKEINEKIDEIYNKYYKSNLNTKQNIKIFHDYIINNTNYDSNNKTGSSDIYSSTAYGLLFDGTGICSAYSDTMALFLDKLGVKNYRISSKTHVWNLVFVEGKWLHLDLTWDDPINQDGSNSLSDDYFLIDNRTLQSKNDNEHLFDENIYIEAK